MDTNEIRKHINLIEGKQYLTEGPLLDTIMDIIWNILPTLSVRTVGMAILGAVLWRYINHWWQKRSVEQQERINKRLVVKLLRMKAIAIRETVESCMKELNPLQQSYVEQCARDADRAFRQRNFDLVEQKFDQILDYLEANHLIQFVDIDNSDDLPS